MWQSIGTPQELYDSPQNVFVARFLGTPKMNMFRIQTDREGRASFGDSSFAKAGRHKPGAEILLGVRPEDIAVKEAGTGKGLLGKINHVESLGAEYFVHVDTHIGNVMVRVMNKNARPEVGGNVSLAVKDQVIHLFDPQSSQRV